MKLEIDVADLEAMLDAWRQSVALETAMTDQFRIMMMANRRQILENLLQTGTGWEQLLRCANPMDDADRKDLQRLRLRLEEFIAWTASELDQLDALAPRGE